MLDDILSDARESMGKAQEAFANSLSKLRTGRANLSLLDGIRVDYYGTPTPLTQVAAVQVADPRLITIKPWDKGLLVAIEKAIVSSSLGITPGNDGELIRLPIPPLTGERRQDLVKQLKRQTEDARISIRNVRRDANTLIKSAKDDLTEDDQRMGLARVQKLTDEWVAKLESMAQIKEAEVMEV